MENSMEVSQNMKAELPNDSAGLFLHIYPKKMKRLSLRAICNPCCTVALFTKSGYVNRDNTHTQEYYSTMKKKPFHGSRNPFATTLIC